VSDPQPPSNGRLLNVLGLAFGLAGSVGGTIGAGILRTPGLVAAQLPSGNLILLAWLLGGIYALLAASCIAELSASLPRAGGWYVYSLKAFGRRFGLVVGLGDWLAHCIGLAWVATTLGEYLAAVIDIDTRLIAVIILSLFGFIQLLGVRASGVSQELLGLAKTVVFIALVLACFLVPKPFELQISDVPQSTVRDVLMSVVLAFQAVMTTYDGWASPVYFAEEFQLPGRDLPRSLIGGVLVVMALYLLLNAALLHVLPIQIFAHSALPAADAATVLFGARGCLVITIVTLVALLGLINTIVMAAPRILYGLSRDELMPSLTAQVNLRGTPVPSLVITLAVTVVLVLAGSFDRLLGVGAFFYMALPLSGLAALVMLREKEPELERPFLCWGYPFTPLLVSLGSVSFIIGSLFGDPVDSLLAIILLLIGGSAAALTLRTA
jgi:APA family basic amino acid/polyamine antiporter